MRVRFWGTRGSIPKPGPTTLRTGGNTSCVEVRAHDGTLVVLDCGTGAYALGRALTSDGQAPVHGHLLIGHTHWDHIQGFPFFEPFFVPGSRWGVYAPGGRGRQLEDSLAGQMAYEYSPINLEALHAAVQFHDLTEGSFELGGIRVRAQYLNHPALTLGYRLEADGAVLVYATDHEPHSLHPRVACAGVTPIHHEDRRHARFLEGADLVVHDAQYTLDEFPGKAGWGHTPVERAVDYAILARARRLALFHHDPERDDPAVEGIAARAQERAAQAEWTPEVVAAREGETIELGGSARTPHPAPGEASALLAAASRRPDCVLIVDDDPDMLALLRASLETEGVRVVTAGDGDAALRVARREAPTLVVLDMHLPGRDGLEVCRALRADRDPRLLDVPILMLTGEKLKETDLVDAFVAGATDYLTKPIKPTLVRSRVRGWLLRTQRRP
jgi:CheY-like chemotaxis protein/phosphoribosyl 1,2-cyclic phosphodiesterase